MAAGDFIVGKSIAVGVYVSSTDQAMNAASGVITFPTDKFEVTSISKNNSIFVIWVQEPTFSNNTGVISFEGIIPNPGFVGSSGKILTINLSGNIFYDEIDASNLGYAGKKSIISESVKLGTNINITPSTILQLNATYRSPTLTPQGKYLSTAVLSLGFRQDLFKKRASLLLSVSDVFNSLRWTSEIDTPELYQKTTGKRKSQIVYLGFTYKLGKAIKKAEDIRFDEGK